MFLQDFKPYFKCGNTYGPQTCQRKHWEPHVALNAVKALKSSYLFFVLKRLRRLYIQARVSLFKVIQLAEAVEYADRVFVER